MASRKNKSLITQRNLSTPTYKTYHEERMAKNAPKPSQNLTPIEKNYFDLSEVKVANETQGRRVKKDTVLVQRTNGVVKRARRGFMVFLIMLFTLLFVAVGALSFLQLPALEDYNSYFNMFTKVEEVIPENVAPEDIESGNFEYDYVVTNIGLDDIIMSFVKACAGDAIEGEYQFYQDAIGVPGSLLQIPNMLAYYAMPILLVFSIVLAIVFFIRAFVAICTNRRRKHFVLSAVLMLVSTMLGIACGYAWCSSLQGQYIMAYLNPMTIVAPLQVGYGYLIMTILSLLALVASLCAFRSKKDIQ